MEGGLWISISDCSSYKPAVGLHNRILFERQRGLITNGNLCVNNLLFVPRHWGGGGGMGGWRGVKVLLLKEKAALLKRI